MTDVSFLDGFIVLYYYYDLYIVSTFTCTLLYLSTSIKLSNFIVKLDTSFINYFVSYLYFIEPKSLFRIVQRH